MPPPTLQFEINGVEHEVEFPHKNGRKNSKTVFDCVDYTGLISYISNLDIEVKEYFRRRKYSGFEEHFKLERLEACSLGNGTMLAYPKGLYGIGQLFKGPRSLKRQCLISLRRKH